jgi:hypothetical protein
MKITTDNANGINTRLPVIRYIDAGVGITVGSLYGWTDALRTLYPEETICNSWDDFRGAISRHAGIRFDHLLLSPDPSPRLRTAGVERDVPALEKTSDHAPSGSRSRRRECEPLNRAAEEPHCARRDPPRPTLSG